MDQISSISSNNFKQEPRETAVELQRQPSFSSGEKKDEFISGKGPLLIAGTAGAVGGWFSATPLAKYFAKKKIDSSIDKSVENIKDVRKFLFNDMPKEEFLSLYNKFENIIKKDDNLAKKICEKIPEALKKLGLDEKHIKFVEENIKKVSDIKIKPTPEEIENMRLAFAEIRKNASSAINEMRSSVMNNEKVGAFFDKLGINEEAFKTVQEKVPAVLNNIETKSKDALSSIRDLVVDNYVKIPSKYKAVSAILGGLSLAGLVAIVKPSPKKS